MMIYTVSEITQIVDGELMGKTNLAVSQILTDSRQLRFPNEVMFVALRGNSGDGHNYIGTLIEAGVKIFMVDHNFVNLTSEDLALIRVDNTLEALQKLAAHHRRQYSYPVIAITGSNGKTIVKEWLYQSMQNRFNIVRSPKSYNSQIGVPLSVLMLDEFADLAIFEAGISLPNEMSKLAKIIQPTIGLLTNLGDAHQENFCSKEEKLSEKIKLFLSCNEILLSSDDPWVLDFVRKTYPDKKIRTWGKNSEDDLRVIDLVQNQRQTTAFVEYKGKQFSLTIGFSDTASLQNSLLTALTLLTLGFTESEIASRLGNLQRVSMRLELVAGKNRCTIINDSYNSDLVSLASSFEFLAMQNQNQRKIAVVSDLSQVGNHWATIYSEVAKLVWHYRFDFLGVGQTISQYKHLFPDDAKFFGTTEELIEYLQKNIITDATLLFKGSRSFRFEEVVNRLQEKLHRTVLEIDLNHLASNLRFFRTLLQPKTRIIAMLKAFGYGSGSFELANILQHHRVDYLAVAFTHEGVHLRQQGIKIPIMVMNPGVETSRDLYEFRLEPVIYSFDFLQDFSVFLTTHSIPQYPVHIKIDTGMNRAGFRQNDIEILIQKLLQNQEVNVISVFSHLAAADDPVFDSFTLEQIRLFDRICSQIEQAIGNTFFRHILNSAGIERFNQFQFDAVRLGIGLYGVSFDRNQQLQPVATFKTRILQIKEVSPPETVGYSRKGILSRKSKIATLPVGYADGYRRCFSNGKGKVLVNGQLVPTVGNICMDITMIDVTDVEVEPGDEVILFGENPSIQQLAEIMHSIPYEVLTGISSRVKRVYVRE